MTERPISFTDDMARWILRRDKRMTRRPVRPQWPADTQPKEHSARPGYWIPCTPAGKLNNGALGSRPDDCGIVCPYGVVGDRLWIQETYAEVPQASLSAYTHHRPDGTPVFLCYRADWPEKDYTWIEPDLMPRWASRATLEITEIRMEPLQSISQQDIAAEGLRAYQETPEVPSRLHEIARLDFAAVWDAIYEAKGFGWKMNPWVWVIRFRILPAPS